MVPVEWAIAIFLAKNRSGETLHSFVFNSGPFLTVNLLLYGGWQKRLKLKRVITSQRESGVS